MRPLTLILAGLLIAIQYPLWFGERSWREVALLENRLQDLQSENARRAGINAGLEAELRDLAEGRQAIEERARYELGLVGPNEIFVQINDAGASRRSSTGIQTASVYPLPR